ncbi:MAG: choice-of-anchor L domain-containing protein [Coriobacteriales bacterium]|nr:choice-of-anchor L domain-containing protein [Coriobacteriales bacterium]
MEKHRTRRLTLAAGLALALVLAMFPAQAFAEAAPREQPPREQSPENQTGDEFITLAIPLDTTMTNEQLVDFLMGPGVTVSNVSFVGLDEQKATFSGATAQVGFDKGILISTGEVTDVFNESVGIPSTDFGGPSDAQLAGLLETPMYTYDAAIIEFEFVPEFDTITFNYVFATSEWDQEPEFDDCFGLFVNGVNYALLQSGSPVTVQNLLGESGLITQPYPPTQGYLVSTENVNDFSFYARSVVLECTAPVNPGVVNHIRIGIIDVSDAVWDSALFLQAKSFSSQAPVMPPKEETAVSDLPPAPVPVTIPQTGDASVPLAIVGGSALLLGGGAIVAAGALRRRKTQLNR